MSQAICVDCAEPLSLWRRVRGHIRCETCEAKYNEEQQQRYEQEQAAYRSAVDEYTAVTDALVPGVDVKLAPDRIQQAMRLTPLAPAEVSQLNVHAVAEYFDRIVADDLVTHQEDIALGESATCSTGKRRPSTPATAT